MSNELGKFLKWKRGDKSLRNYAEYLGISHAYLDSLEKGIDPKTNKPINVSVDTMTKISKKTNTSVEAILSMISGNPYQKVIKLDEAQTETNMEVLSPEQLYEIIDNLTDSDKKMLFSDYLNFDNATPIDIDSDIIKIPVYGTIKAGIPIESQTDIIDYVEIPREWTKGNKKFYGLKISGDSMYPKYSENDIVIFEQNEDVEAYNNKDVAVMINGTESTFKKILVTEQGIVLQPYNLAYDTMMFSKEQVENLPIKVVGIAREKRTKL